MDGKYIQLISQFRDLGTKSQILIENFNEHEKGINLKRDAAGFLIDYFLKYSNDRDHLKNSLFLYSGFSSFFIRARLERVVDSIAQDVHPYKHYADNISEKFKEFPRILSMLDDARSQCFDLHAFIEKDFSKSDVTEMQKIYDVLNDVSETIEKLETAQGLVKSNLEVMRATKVLVLSKNLRNWIFVTVAVAIIGTIIKNAEVFRIA